MEKRLALIDLDWLEGEISIYEESASNYTGEPQRTHEKVVNVLELVRSNCTPIEQPTVFLSKTCLNYWGSNKFCDKEDACEMCVNGKLK